MKLFASERIRSNDSPCFLCPGRAVKIPRWYVEPTAEGYLDISIGLEVEPYAWRYYELTVDDSKFLQILVDFREDPEGCLKTLFGWEPPQTTGPMSAKKLSGGKTNMTLSDLGLG